jgi:hypothetical protein
MMAKCAGTTPMCRDASELTVPAPHRRLLRFRHIALPGKRRVRCPAPSRRTRRHDAGHRSVRGHPERRSLVQQRLQLRRPELHCRWQFASW